MYIIYDGIQCHTERKGTMNERRAYYDEPELVRAKRRPHILDPYNERYGRSCSKSWKKRSKRRKQYQEGKRVRRSEFFRFVETPGGGEHSTVLRQIRNKMDILRQAGIQPDYIERKLRLVEKRLSRWSTYRVCVGHSFNIETGQKELIFKERQNWCRYYEIEIELFWYERVK